MTALAKRAVACKGWRWMAGAADDEHRVMSVDGGTLHIVSIEGGMDDWCSARAMGSPDLDDPATLGCFMFALLPEAWGTADITLSPDGVTWAVFVDGAKVSEETDKLEALVAALESAP